MLSIQYFQYTVYNDSFKLQFRRLLLLAEEEAKF